MRLTGCEDGPPLLEQQRGWDLRIAGTLSGQNANAMPANRAEAAMQRT